VAEGDRGGLFAAAVEVVDVEDFFLATENVVPRHAHSFSLVVCVDRPAVKGHDLDNPFAVDNQAIIDNQHPFHARFNCKLPNFIQFFIFKLAHSDPIRIQAQHYKFLPGRQGH
jgi:hypothetical protein